MDYPLSKRIMKVPKIPDKNNYQYSFNQITNNLIT